MIELDASAVLGAVSAAFVGVVAWVGRRHFEEDDKREKRLQALEQTTATRADIEAVEKSISELRTAVNDNHAEILKAINPAIFRQQ